MTEQLENIVILHRINEFVLQLHTSFLLQGKLREVTIQDFPVDATENERRKKGNLLFHSKLVLLRFNRKLNV